MWKRGLRLSGALLFIGILLGGLSWGCATHQDTADNADIGEAQGSDISRSIFYSKAAEKQRRKAEQYLEMAISHEKVQGADSALAAHYRLLAAQSLKSAEENARFSRFHHQLVEEEFEALRQEMFPQP